MMARLVVALLALLGVTAFAPAPFPKPERKGDRDSISVETCQGTWRVASMMNSRKDGKHSPYNWNINRVRVKGNNWTFVDRNGSDSATYLITIKNDKKPASLDFYSGQINNGPGSGQGIIRRKGTAVEIIYVFGGNNRPISFEQPPDGQYLLTLQRQ